MGINLGGLATSHDDVKTQAAGPAPEVLAQPGVQQVDRGNGQLSLNLSKGISLELAKAAPSLKHVLVGCGWDVAQGASMDLDVFALLLHNGKIHDTSDIIYFGQLDTGKGVKLDGDNRTGEGEGDDEKLHVDLDRVPSDVTSIMFFVSIYEATKKSQNFGMVQNAYVRLVNEDTNKEECIYVLNEEGGLFNTFQFAELKRSGSGWTFDTIGEGSNGDVQTIANKYA